MKSDQNNTPVFYDWPFLYQRRIIRPDELCQLKFCSSDSSSDSSSDKFFSMKTGSRRIIPSEHLVRRNRRHIYQTKKIMTHNSSIARFYTTVCLL